MKHEVERIVKIHGFYIEREVILPLYLYIYIFEFELEFLLKIYNFNYCIRRHAFLYFWKHQSPMSIQQTNVLLQFIHLFRVNGMNKSFGELFVLKNVLLFQFTSVQSLINMLKIVKALSMLMPYIYIYINQS